MCLRLFTAIITLVIAVAIAGCGHWDGEATALGARDLAPVTSVYIAVPADGHFGTKTYAGSGLTTAQLITEAFAARLGGVACADKEQSLKATLAAARARGLSYLISPAILRWEDHSSAWSGIDDIVEIRLLAIDTASGNAADFSVIRRRGNMESFAGARPENLLPAPLKTYVERLLGAPVKQIQAGHATQH